MYKTFTLQHYRAALSAGTASERSKVERSESRERSILGIGNCGLNSGHPCFFNKSLFTSLPYPRSTNVQLRPVMFVRFAMPAYEPRVLRPAGSFEQEFQVDSSGLLS